jgi:hypothetical protein
VSDHGRAHAHLSPSSAERWLACPGSVRLSDSLERSDDSGSVFAEEGTRAHTLAYLEASRAFDLMDERDYLTHKAAWLRQAEAHGDDVEEMEEGAREYVTVLQDIHSDLAEDGPVQVLLERRVDPAVPGSWGTADAILVGIRRIAVVDYKFGRGVVVEVERNPQVMLYGLGALELMDLLGTIEDVDLVVVQPRAGGISRWSLSADDLKGWRETVVLPVVAETSMPEARLVPGDAAGVCKARAAWVTRRDFGDPDLMDEDDLADAVRRLKEIRDWCNAVEAEALRQAYSYGARLPGLKVVMSGGKRTIKDKAAAIDRLVAAGFSRSKVAREDTQTLSALERLVGAERLVAVLGDLLVRSPGSPSLVPEDDRREAVTSLSQAETDFREDPEE